jgi:hypothetical protein
MSAAFCGVEVLARECRGGVTDKWNNMMGACSAGCVGNIGKGPGDPPSLHPPSLSTLPSASLRVSYDVRRRVRLVSVTQSFLDALPV